MEKQTLLYEGKAKRVYATQNPELLIVSYKDDATANRMVLAKNYLLYSAFAGIRNR